MRHIIFYVQERLGQIFQSSWHCLHYILGRRCFLRRTLGFLLQQTLSSRVRYSRCQWCGLCYNVRDYRFILPCFPLPHSDRRQDQAIKWPCNHPIDYCISIYSSIAYGKWPWGLLGLFEPSSGIWSMLLVNICRKCWRVVKVIRVPTDALSRWVACSILPWSHIQEGSRQDHREWRRRRYPR